MFHETLRMTLAILEWSCLGSPQAPSRDIKRSINGRTHGKGRNVEFSARCWRQVAILGLMAFVFLAPMALAEEIQLAVAANFSAPMQEIAARFEKTSGHKVKLIFGATGMLYAEIKNGAPFDILLAADSETPEKLVREGEAVAESRFTYAIGKLVLWSPKPTLVDGEGRVLKIGAFEHLAICNPKLAPYGAASEEVMKALGVYEMLKPKVVEGENVTQAFQFVASGAAELGFVALSQVYRRGKIQGSAWIVPANLYSPIRQDAVVLTKSESKLGPGELMKYLRSEPAQTIIRSYGYELY